MEISIFGYAGTGTTTLGKFLAKELSLKFYSTGELMRDLARKEGVDIYRFENLCQNDLNYDRKVDFQIKRIGELSKNYVIDSRLAWYFIPNSFKIYVECDQEIRIKRIAKREKLSFEEALSLTSQRESIVKRRFKSLYPTLLFPPKKEDFNIVVNSSRKRVENLVEEIRKELI